MNQSTTAGVAVPGATGRAPRRNRQVAAQVYCEAAFPRDRSARLCQGQRSARRWRRNPLVTPSNATKRVRCREHPPIEDCWLAEHIRLWQGGFDLAHLLGLRSPGDAIPAPIRLALAGQPTRSRLARLPLNAFQNIARGAGSEFVDCDADINANAIHCFRHVVACVTRQVLPQRIAKKLTAGALGAPRPPLRRFEDVVWYRYCCFHTKSITTPSNKVKRKCTEEKVNGMSRSLLPKCFQQLAVKNALIFGYQPQPERASRGADQPIGEILRKSVWKHCRQRGDLRRSFVDDNAGIFYNRSHAGFHRSGCAQSPMREQHGQFPKADRRNRYSSRFGCFSNRGSGAARQALGIDCKPNQNMRVEQNHVNRLSEPWGRLEALLCRP